MIKHIGLHAVVIGGSVAGLLSARVLAGYFEKVTILEKDNLPQGPLLRKTIPQGNHLHAILSSGLNLLENFFPGIVQQMEEPGVELVDFARDICWLFQGSWRSRHTSNVKCLLSLRPYLEWHIRNRLMLDCHNVTIRENCMVKGLLTNKDKSVVTGVTMLCGSNNQTENIEAALTVDACGRGSETPLWLTQMGYTAPKEAALEINLGYASRLYSQQENFDDGWKALVLFPKMPHAWRLGLMAHIQGNQCMVTMNGYFGDHAPVDDAGFLAFARSLPKPDIYNYIKDKVPLGKTKVYKIPKVYRRYYEKLPRFPEGLIVTGDANCVFNPIFGQGITLAAFYAKALQQSLNKQSSKPGNSIIGLSKKFQYQASRHLNLPWFLTTAIDLSYAQTKGSRPPAMPVISWFLRYAIEVTSKDKKLYQTFINVMHMQAGLSALLAPSFLLPVFWYIIKSAFVPINKRAHTAGFPQPV
ncbi:NAD(P)/FAD-dependent oxidoreductase [Foetidibacter luteolus]|uniref:NAD(P)/FAD-dependent oxidoreductase n=1 Tax=Foetidibacter luteolus TaxID=2608880 RepID=UPI00129BFB5F|nr:hypothetical protein [Foetidibacter luteolus]